MAAYKTSLSRKDLKESAPVRVEVNGKPVMIVMIKDRLYAIGAVCSHKGGPLEKGKVDGYNVVCPWHGATYDVRTGKGSEKTPWGTGQDHYKISTDSSGVISLEF